MDAPSPSPSFVARLPAWLRQLAQPLLPFARAFALWSDAGGTRMAAAMSFYGILSLAPLLLLLVGVLGWWMDRDALQSGLLQQLGSIVGARGTAVLEEAIRSAQEPAQGLTASVVGFGVLLFGATGVFGELQTAFQNLWNAGRPPVKNGWRHEISLRLRGVAYVLVFGFLLLVSLAISTLLGLFSGWAGQWLPLETLLRVLNEAAAFAVCGALFVGLMRLSGGHKPATRFLVFGGFVGAILFTAGRQLLAAYLSGAAVVSAYGAAGSLIVLLMWIYFSSAVLLLGAASARSLEETLAQRGSKARRWAATSATAAPTPATSSTTRPQR